MGIFKKKCNHEGMMYPLFDNIGWTVGYVCDCGYFEYRKGIPNRDARLRQYLEEKAKDKLKEIEKHKKG